MSGEDNINETIVEFVTASIAHAEANKRGDEEAARLHAAKKATVYRDLKDRGVKATKAFMTLLDHPDPEVRLAAAGYALELNSTEAERVLEELSANPDMALDAGMALFVWRSGEMKFP